MRITVLGAGSWGTALARLLAGAGRPVTLWGRDPAQIREMAAARENRRYLPGHALPDAVALSTSLAEATAAADLLVLALPSAHVRATAAAIATGRRPDAIVVCASKGLEETTGWTLDRVLEAVMPGAPVVLLSGPTFAEEIARGLPAAAVAASRNAGAADAVQRAFATDRFRVYTSDDVTGVAIGGALKNVIAIAAGAADGLGFGYNARAALITRGLHELGRLAERLGAHRLTLSGLAGLGDLALTCTGELSRNRRVGLLLAAGQPLAEITARLGHVAEGVLTARIAARLARELGVEMPITCQVAAVLEGRSSAREAVADLLAREQGPERG